MPPILCEIRAAKSATNIADLELVCDSRLQVSMTKFHTRAGFAESLTFPERWTIFSLAHSLDCLTARLCKAHSKSRLD